MVRLEIATALERGIPVIPVLVRGVQVPREADLPIGLTDLAYRVALEVSDARFRSDVERLIEALEAPYRKFQLLSSLSGIFPPRTISSIRPRVMPSKSHSRLGTSYRPVSAPIAPSSSLCTHAWAVCGVSGSGPDIGPSL